MPPVILGFDPGRAKCGLALLGIDSQVVYHQVVAAGDVLEVLQRLQGEYQIVQVVMGNQTGSQSWIKRLAAGAPALPAPVLVDERHTTLQARRRYWQMCPSRGWRRLIPLGLRVPPRSVDDIAAMLLVERYLAQTQS